MRPARTGRGIHTACFRRRRRPRSGMSGRRSAGLCPLSGPKRSVSFPLSTNYSNRYRFAHQHPRARCSPRDTSACFSPSTRPFLSFLLVRMSRRAPNTLPRCERPVSAVTDIRNSAEGSRGSQALLSRPLVGEPVPDPRAPFPEHERAVPRITFSTVSPATSVMLIDRLSIFRKMRTRDESLPF